MGTACGHQDDLISAEFVEDLGDEEDWGESKPKAAVPWKKQGNTLRVLTPGPVEREFVVCSGSKEIPEGAAPGPADGTERGVMEP